MHNSKHWPRIADFGSCDGSIPWDARGFSPKIVKTPGLSQEDVDKEFTSKLDARMAKLNEREAEIRSSTAERIEAGKSKNPRFAAEKVRVDRASRPDDDRQTGLRL